MVALPGMGGHFHFAQQCIHLFRRQTAAGTDTAVAGHRGTNVFEPLLESKTGAEFFQVVSKVL